MSKNRKTDKVYHISKSVCDDLTAAYFVAVGAKQAAQPALATAQAAEREFNSKLVEVRANLGITETDLDVNLAEGTITVKG